LSQKIDKKAALTDARSTGLTILPTSFFHDGNHSNALGFLNPLSVFAQSIVVAGNDRQVLIIIHILYEFI
jgi:hypothetical protein